MTSSTFPSTYKWNEHIKNDLKSPNNVWKRTCDERHTIREEAVLDSIGSRSFDHAVNLNGMIMLSSSGKLRFPSLLVHIIQKRRRIKYTTAFIINLWLAYYDKYLVKFHTENAFDYLFVWDFNTELAVCQYSCPTVLIGICNEFHSHSHVRVTPYILTD